mmetsp:Transcript_22321/g.33878  ORF Transcript_22321/g.33878 Transcript_22321/m.33878 type:complete len:1299 (+) Transcript_22321:62-3958(+)
MTLFSEDDDQHDDVADHNEDDGILPAEQNCDPHAEMVTTNTPYDLEHALERQLGRRNSKRWLRQLTSAKESDQLAERLALRLDNACHLLLDRLFQYLSKLPAENESPSTASVTQGLTLPASAVGWLATQMYPSLGKNNDDSVLPSSPLSSSPWIMGASMRDRISLLKYLLPRATHLRITSDKWPPASDSAESNSSDQSGIVSFVGRDLDLDHLSVHSSVTIETFPGGSATGAPSIQSFLLYYHHVHYYPRVDLRVFPNLTVLFLDRVPSEWIWNLSILQSKLKLLRYSKACIFDISNFLFQGDASSKEVGNPSCKLTSLTLLKLNHAGLGEMSGLQGKRRKHKVHASVQMNNGETKKPNLQGGPPLKRYSSPPPLSRLPNLKSLSLAHNEIHTVKSALAGLKSLSHLEQLDLSYNRLTTMKGASRMLGNITTLALSGNNLKNIEGLDKLYSLQTLHLDKNQFSSITDIAGLGNLPDLMMLSLNDNPLVEKEDLLRYRIQVLDLFKSKRFYQSLVPGATYRDLLKILPVLDGEPATKRELMGLRLLTFRRANAEVSEIDQREAAGEESDVPQEVNLTQVNNVEEHQSQVVFRLIPTTPSRPRRVTRNKGSRTKKALVLNGEGAEKTRREAVSNETKSTHKPTDLPNIEFTTHDVISSLPTKVEIETARMSEEEDSKSDCGAEKRKRCSPHLNLSSISMADGELEESNCDSNGTLKVDNMLPKAVINSIDVFSEDDLSENLLDNYSAKSFNPKEGGRSAEENKTTSSLSGKDLSQNTSIPTNDESQTVLLEPHTDCQVHDQIMSGGEAELQKSDGNNSKIERSANPFEQDTMSSKSSVSNATDSENYIQQPNVSFPEEVWNDTSSVNSSNQAELALKLKYQKAYTEAEACSVYDGPDGYKKLSINGNLELYFRLFIFSTELEIDTTGITEGDDEKLTRIVNETSPRIQLRPVDRHVSEQEVKKAMGSTETVGMRETFKKVWQEDIIACGKSATRRISPHKKLLRGFHGDPLAKDGDFRFSVESRKVIFCTSDAAVYIITDHDEVSTKAIQDNSKRKFASPIPHKALFQNALWPHAFARLPIETLKRITIGFGFQRLILHFVPSSNAEKLVLGSDLTLILATSKKVDTMRLLQHLQGLSKETQGLSSVVNENNSLIIDNDDKQVLDALALAVAPCAVDVVMHYQVLHQYWKSGDRGTIRRACVITDTHIFLLDECYVGDGAENSFPEDLSTLGEARYNLVDSAVLSQIVEVQPARSDPKTITIVIRPDGRLQRNHNWRLLCRDGEGAERLVDATRKAMNMA